MLEPTVFETPLIDKARRGGPSFGDADQPGHPEVIDSGLSSPK